MLYPLFFAYNCVEWVVRDELVESRMIGCIVYMCALTTESDQQHSQENRSRRLLDRWTVAVIAGPLARGIHCIVTVAD